MIKLLFLVGLALASEGFETSLKAAAAKAPEAAFSQAGDLPVDFAAFLKRKGVEAKGLSNSKAAALYAEFKAAPAATGSAAKVTPAPAAPLDDVPFRFTGIELGKGPHPGGDLFDGAADRKGIGLGARVRLDGLGLRVQYRHEADAPAFSVGFLKVMDVVGSMNLDRAREGIYDANFAPVETPQGGFEVSGSAVLDNRYGLSASYSDKETIFPPLDRTRLQKADLGFGLTPLGKNGGKPWNFTLQFSPDYQWLERGPADAPEKKDGVGFSTGGSFRLALNKLMPAFLQPPPKGNGVVWPDQAKTGVSVAASEVSPMTIEWATQVSLYITKYLLVTPGVRTTLRPTPGAVAPDGSKVGVAPMLGLDVKNLSL